MNGKITKELVLEGLNCAHCATKIEDTVNSLRGVSTASVNFMARTLTLETEQIDNVYEIINEVKSIVKKIEPDVIVSEKIMTKSPKKVLILMGLDCAHCADKIEKGVQNIPGVKSASVDFISKKLTIEVEAKRDLTKIVEQANELIRKIEPGVDVVEEDKDTKDIPGEAESNKKEIIRIAIGAALFGIALLPQLTFGVKFSLYLISYLLVGGEVVLRAVKNISRGQVFDENFLMSVATIGAFAIKEFPEGVAVMLFYQVGELFQSMAVNKSRKSIKALLDIRPDFANLKTGNEINKVSPEAVKVGDVIVVKPGEKIPLDGKVIDGASMVDTSALTGESLPREVEAGSDVLSGYINKNGVLTIEVIKEYSESTIAKILDLVQNAGSKKAPTENFITKFARYYTPVVVFAALAIAVIPPLVISGATYGQWIYRALVFLVISCPCALVISIPLGFFGGIGAASRNGILIKGGNYLEALNQVNTAVFDKTGTLTKGVFKVTGMKPQDGVTNEELIESAAYAEVYSNHPIAQSIMNAYGREIDKEEIEGYNEISGHGIKVKVKGKEILAGNKKLMEKEKIAYDAVDDVAGTIVHVAVEGNYAGYIVISDEIKNDSARAMQELKKIGVKKLVMLTGDNKVTGEQVAKDLGLDEVHTELLPTQKVEILEGLVKQKTGKGSLVFVGDGINDAPVLARADVGIAMGGLGSDAAIEAADVVLITDEPTKLAQAMTIARKTRNVVWQNIFFAMGVKAIVLILGAGGIATLWEAVFADVGVAIIAILNAMRVLYTKMDKHDERLTSQPLS